MAFRSAIATWLVQHVLKRPVTLDPNTPIRVLIGLALSSATGLARGLLLAQRRLVMGRGARIIDPRHFRTGGGLIRLGEHSKIECTSIDGIRVGRNFKLGAFSRMIASGTLSDLGRGITIGDNVGISEFSYIGGAGGVRIGSDVIVGQYFSTHPENHNFAELDQLIREQGVSREGIEIGSNCWIGARVTILDGVKLGKGCVVAAGSVVNREFPDNSIIGGVPARLIRMREATANHKAQSCENSND